MAPEQVFFEPDKAIVWWIYDPVGVAATNLPNGLHKVTFQAEDWAGNAGEGSVYFQVDNALTAPKVPGQEEMQPGMMPGMPGMPGMPMAPGMMAPPPPPMMPR